MNPTTTIDTVTPDENPEVSSTAEMPSVASSTSNTPLTTPVSGGTHFLTYPNLYCDLMITITDGESNALL